MLLIRRVTISAQYNLLSGVITNSAAFHRQLCFHFDNEEDVCPSVANCLAERLPPGGQHQGQIHLHMEKGVLGEYLGVAPTAVFMARL